MSRGKPRGNKPDFANENSIDVLQRQTQLAAVILAFIPAHKIYAEPFIGGAAVYNGKRPEGVPLMHLAAPA
jgi:hypothetical protein